MIGYTTLGTNYILRAGQFHAAPPPDAPRTSAVPSRPQSSPAALARARVRSSTATCFPLRGAARRACLGPPPRHACAGAPAGMTMGRRWSFAR